MNQEEKVNKQNNNSETHNTEETWLDLEAELPKNEKLLLKINKPSIFDRFFVPLALTVLILTTVILFLENQSYLDQTKTKSNITTLIENNAKLSTIKHVFNNKEIMRSNTLTSIFRSKVKIYPDNISLSLVLSDIEADLFLSGKPDKDKLARIHKIIKSNNTQNPFDGLPVNQRDIFDNIVLKSNDNYSSIQSDVNKLANEIRTKNIQIRNNDTKVEINYYITIISFITAIAIAAFQIFQSRPKKMKEIIIAALKEVESKSKEMPNK